MLHFKRLSLKDNTCIISYKIVAIVAGGTKFANTSANSIFAVHLKGTSACFVIQGGVLEKLYRNAVVGL